MSSASKPLAALALALASTAQAQIMTTIAGTDWVFSADGENARNTPFASVQGVAVGPDGSVYASDALNNVIVRIDQSNTVRVVAGNGIGGFSGDGGPARQASVFAPTGIAVDPAGNVYVAENFNFRIRKVAPDGTISTFAGTGERGFGGDNGPAIRARLDNVHGVAIGVDNSVYFADFGNNRIRKIAPNGVITTVAGNGRFGFGGDNGPAVTASLAFPTGIALDRLGNLYIADQQNGLIRKVALDGVITSITNDVGGCPTGVTVDSENRVSSQIPAAVESFALVLGTPR
jgi:sugar lactone lactonase YvrE